MLFPEYRPRRLRQNEAFRRMIRETVLNTNDFILPLFAIEGKDLKNPIASMPGQYQMSVDHIVKTCQEVHKLGIPAVMLFGVPDKKDPLATSAYSKDGIVQRAVKAVKNKIPDLAVITDVCLCQYTDHGHCGVVEKNMVDNDASLDLLARTALSHAKAGADMVAPSDMMDGRVAEIRESLDENGFTHVPIMSYAAKYCSGFYGPFPPGSGFRAQIRRPQNLSDGSGQRPGGHPGSDDGHRGRRGHHHGQTRPGLSGCHLPGPPGI